MGGNALGKNVRRYEKEEYLIIEKQVLAIIAKYVKKWHIPRYFSNKESFGDMDILYVPKSSVSFHKELEKEFKSTKVFINGDVISYEFNKFQIDMIKTNDVNFEMYSYYLDYNDLGGIIGTITSPYKIKFGHAGLWCNTYHDNDVTKPIGVIVLSNDIQEICIFLGLDYKQWKNGFETELEMFLFITKCKLFNSSFFKIGYGNYVHRFRQIKRPVYIRFMEYCSETFEQVKLEIDWSTEQYKAITYFNKKNDFDKNIIRYKYNTLFKTKFNGLIVTELTGLENKKLGDFIQKIKLTIDDFKEYIMISNKETISMFIKEYFIIYNKG
jgi:hypothetical protein